MLFLPSRRSLLRFIFHQSRTGGLPRKRGRQLARMSAAEISRTSEAMPTRFRRRTAIPAPVGIWGTLMPPPAMPRVRQQPLLHPRVSGPWFSDFSLIDLLFIDLLWRKLVRLRRSGIRTVETRDKTPRSPNLTNLTP